jgi:hypothetical protein
MDTPKNEQPQGQQPQQIKIADNIPGAEYSNAMQVNHTKDEFHLVFFNILGASGRVCGKTITNPGHFKRMVKVMEENLKKYEDRFGQIKETEVEDKQIGFQA